MDAVARAVATTVVKDAYKKAKKSADHIFAYKDYLYKYKEQRDKLISKQTDIKALVADGERKGERVLDEVDKWLAWVEEFLKPPDKKEGEKRGGLEFVLASLVVTPAEKNEQVAGEKSRFWKEPKMRHNLSKMAEKKANAIREKINEINSRGTQVTIPRGPSKYGPSVEGDFFTELKSREELLKQIMNTLKGDKTNKIGIHGMGGAGKSTLVKEIAGRAENKMSFKAVIIAEISRVPNIKHIQDQIAGKICLPLDSFGTLEDRASRLYDRLDEIKRQRDDTSREQHEEGGKLLIILDNLWEKLNLRSFGIYPDLENDMGCKIIVTSRRDDLCKTMGVVVPYIYKVGDLSDEEAKLLFKNKVGDIADDLEHTRITEKLLTRCSCLPLSINVLANMLKDQSIYIWEDIAERLEKCTRGESNGILSETYSILETSYNSIDNEEKKEFFLLCCIFPPGSSISIDDLLRYGIGLGLFQHMDSLVEAIKQAEKWANELVSSSLLLEFDIHTRQIKIHEDIREAGKLIAEKGDQRAFHVGAISRQLKKKTYQKYTVISLASDHNYEYPASLSLPKLKVLRLQDAIQSRLYDNYFSMMEKLKVLDLANSNIKTFPQSIEQLRSLKTLLLENCLLGDISRICKLVKLQVLNLKGSNIKELPKELGNLVRLRLLDLTCCKDLKIIHAGMFTNLTLLEGLYMRDSFDDWRSSKEGCIFFSNWRPKEDMASLSELECCVCLQVLEVQISSSKQLAKGDFVIPNLSSFKINFGKSVWKKDVSSLSRYLEVYGVAYSDLDKEGWKAVMKKAKTIFLEGFYHSLSGFDCAKVGMSSVLNVFPNDLQKLILSDLRGFDCAMPVHCANRLKLLEVRRCKNLEYIFEATKELDLIELPFLEELYLSDLESFRGLCTRSSKEHDRMIKPLFTKQVTFPRLAKLKLEFIDNIDNLWDMTSEKEFTQTVPMLQSIQLERLPNLKNVWSMEVYERSYNFKYLEVLEIRSCHSMESVCPVVVAVALERLKELKIDYCKAMKQVILVGAICEDEGQTITFSSLSTLSLVELPSLTCFYEGSLCMEFSALKELRLWGLNKLETFAKPAERLNRKESEEVECDDDVWTMELISSEKLWNDITLKKALFINGKALFPSLEELTVSHVNSIEELCSSKHDVSNKELSSRGIFSFRSLKAIYIKGCSSIKTVCPPWVAIELQQLESLTLLCCDNLIHVVSTELESQMRTSSIPNGTISFSSLSEFRAEGMNKLACFYQGSLRMEFPALKELRLLELKELEMFVRFKDVYTRSDGDGDHVRANSLFSDETAFLCLESLYLWTIDNIETIWGVAGCQEFDLKFPKLKILRLEKIPKLRYVWTGAISSFGNIKNMRLIRCEVLEGLFSSSSSHVLPLGSHQYVKCDSLEELYIGKLPKIETLLGKVEKLGDDEYNTDQWGQQANRSSKRENANALFNCKINQLPSLAKLHLVDMDKLEGIYDVVDYQEDYSSIIFPKLKTLVIKHCYFRQAWLQNVTSLDISWFDQLRTLFSDKDDDQGFIIKSLSALENVECLTIQHCGSLEQLFEVNNIIEDEHGANSAISLHLPRLKQLEVCELPRLNHIPFHMLPNLQSLKIRSSLEKSKFLISAGCAAQGSILQHLQILEVESCHMDAIVADEPDHEVSCACCCDQNGPAAPEAVVAHEFPSLKQVKLEYLPCLSNFDATVTCDVRLPCLDSLKITYCPMLQLFSTGNVIAPQLSFIRFIYGGDKLVHKDLNTTLNMRFYAHNKGIEQWPKTLKHKLHKEHALTLLIQRQVGDACMGCQQEVFGQHIYHCRTCEFFLDSTCALDSSQLVEEPDEMKIAKDWPLTLNHELHTCELNLIAGKVYNCEICSQKRFDLFSYYCHGCNYGLHPTCALEEAPPVSVTDTHTPPYQGSSTLNNPISSTTTRKSSSDAQVGTELILCPNSLPEMGMNEGSRDTVLDSSNRFQNGGNEETQDLSVDVQRSPLMMDRLARSLTIITTRPVDTRIFREEALRRWKTISGITALSRNKFVVTFDSKEGKEEVLCTPQSSNDEWLIRNWTVADQPQQRTSRVVIRGLPLQLRCEDNVRAVARLLGKLIAIENIDDPELSTSPEIKLLLETWRTDIIEEEAIVRFEHEVAKISIVEIPRRITGLYGGESRQKGISENPDNLQEEGQELLPANSLNFPNLGLEGGDPNDAFLDREEKTLDMCSRACAPKDQTDSNT